MLADDDSVHPSRFNLVGTIAGGLPRYLAEMADAEDPVKRMLACASIPLAPVWRAESDPRAGAAATGSPIRAQNRAR